MSAEPRRVAILDDYQEVAQKCADWGVLKDRVTIDTYTDTIHDEDALVERLKPYEIVCAMRERTKFTQTLLDRLPNLKFIATTGTRNLGIDVKHANSKGIVVSGTGGSGNPTLEHIWALLLATVKNVAREDQNIKAGNPRWQTAIPVGLGGKTLGLIGVGNLGAQVAKIAKAFDMRVVGWSPNLTPERAEAAGVAFASSKEELLRTSDVVSLHMVLSASTRHIIKREDLNLLKPTAFLINTSRGPLVDEDALIEALQEGKFAGAGLDVYDIEPLPLDHPIRKLKNVTLTPHSAYITDDNYKVFYGETVDNIVAYLAGKPERIMT